MRSNRLDCKIRVYKPVDHKRLKILRKNRAKKSEETVIRRMCEVKKSNKTS